MSILEALDALKVELLLMHPQVTEKTKSNSDAMRWELIKRIETVCSMIIDNIASDEFPVLEAVDRTNCNNYYFDGRIKMKKSGIKTRRISFGARNSRSKFVIVMYLLSKIHKLLTIGKTCTRREIYYKNVQIFKSQRQVDENMKDISYILKSPSWALGVLATSKGIVSGPLTLHLKNGEFVSCSEKGGVSIPSNVSDIENLSSSAKWVLIIEKDSSFQRFIGDEVVSRLGPCIIITGKGFPDVNTRMLVCKFWEILQIPILALNDADPYGFEIMCVYRFGSLSMSSHSTNLACPAVRWLGIHPSDIRPLLLDCKSLSVRDIRKIRCMMQTSQVKENEKLKNQLEIFLKENVKAEIEGLSNISTYFMIDIYLKNKIQCKEYF